jgi:quinohemoprotein ethanol dehydrogenase
MRRLITFSLDGEVDMPPLPPPFYPEPIVIPEFEIDEQLAQQGEQIYWSCFNCHGGNMFGGGMSPDLRASAVPLDEEAFAATVRDGVKISMGMPAYPDMSDEELKALRHFIRKRAIETYPDYEALIHDGSTGGSDSR